MKLTLRDDSSNLIIPIFITKATIKSEQLLSSLSSGKLISDFIERIYR
jgi:hypothetical protein